MPAPRSLVEQEADVARDLALTAHPRMPWLVQKTAAGAPARMCRSSAAGGSIDAIAAPPCRSAGL